MSRQAKENTINAAYMGRPQGAKVLCAVVHLQKWCRTVRRRAATPQARACPDRSAVQGHHDPALCVRSLYAARGHLKLVRALFNLRSRRPRRRLRRRRPKRDGLSTQCAVAYPQRREGAHSTVSTQTLRGSRVLHRRVANHPQQVPPGPVEPCTSPLRLGSVYGTSIRSAGYGTMSMIQVPDRAHHNKDRAYIDRVPTMRMRAISPSSSPSVVSLHSRSILQAMLRSQLRDHARVRLVRHAFARSRHRIDRNNIAVAIEERPTTAATVKDRIRD